MLTRRQKEILDYVQEFIRRQGYAPSLIEISRHFQLNSISTIHKHLVNLEEKGLIRRSWNRARAIELVPATSRPPACELAVEGLLEAGRPLEPARHQEKVPVTEDLVGAREAYLLRARGEGLADEQIRDGDYLVMERRTEPRNGETVVALLAGDRATVKKFYREKGRVRFQPANVTEKPTVVDEKTVRIEGIVIGLVRKY